MPNRACQSKEQTSKQPSSPQIAATGAESESKSHYCLRRFGLRSVIAFILTSSLGVSLWYIKECLDDRKKAIADFQESSVVVEATLDKYNDDVLASFSALTEFEKSLRSSITSEIVLKQQHEAELSSYRIGYEDCLKYEEALYRYAGTRRKLEHLFFLPAHRWGDRAYPPSQPCSWLQKLQQDTTVYDVHRLPIDRQYRKQFIGDDTEAASLMAEIKSVLERVKGYPEFVRAQNEAILRTVENRSANLSRSSFECLKHMLGFKAASR